MTAIPRHIAALKRLSAVSSIAVFLIGGLALAGWFFDIAALTTWYPGLTTMKANTAACFVLLGGSLWLSQASRPGRRFRIPAHVAALVVVLLALLTLLEYGVARDLGLDRLLFIEPPTAFSLSPPGRMTPITAVILLLAGLSLLATQVKDRRGTTLHQSLAMLAWMCALLTLLGYAYGAMTVLGRTVGFTGMSLPAVAAANLLSAGLLWLRPDHGFMRIFTSDTLGSRIARRLMPVTVAVPVALHFWTLMQTRLGLLDRDSAAVIDTMTTIAIFGAFVLLTSRMMNDLDTERRQREADLRDSEARFRAVTDTAGDAIVAAGPSGRIELWNKTAATIFGYASAEILGRSVSTIIPDRFQSAHEPAFEWAVATGESKLAGRPVELVGRRKDGSECPVELSLALWKAGEENHFTGIIRDISERKRAEAEREQLISDLKQAVTEIRTLEGFIPICAGCKKIRDDQGFWEHVENYVARNTEAKFSHGICPDCEKRLYPEE